MKPVKNLKIFLLLALLGLWVPMVVADGNERPASQGEKNFHNSVIKTLAQAVPSGPVGWTQTNDTTQIKELERVGVGSEKYPFQIYYRIAWKNTNAIYEAEDKLQLELAKHTAPDPELKALNAQSNELIAQYGQALEQKNNAEANRINMEMEALSQKMQAINARLDKEMEAVLIKMAPHDVEVKIVLNANVTSEGIYEEDFKPAASIAGGLTYRSAGVYDPANGWSEGTTFVFLGRGWRLNGNYMETTFNKSLPHTVVQTIVVKIQADPDRTPGIIQQIDWDALKKMVTN